MPKATWKSTEFWFTAIGLIAGLVMAIVPESDITNCIGGILAAVFGGTYTVGRSTVKSNREKTLASAALLDAVKKK